MQVLEPCGPARWHAAPARSMGLRQTLASDSLEREAAVKREGRVRLWTAGLWTPATVNRQLPYLEQGQRAPAHPVRKWGQPKGDYRGVSLDTWPGATPELAPALRLAVGCSFSYEPSYATPGASSPQRAAKAMTAQSQVGVCGWRCKTAKRSGRSWVRQGYRSSRLWLV